MAFDDEMTRLDDSIFYKSDWRKSINGQEKEEIPSTAPKSLGDSVTMTCFADAIGAGDKIARRFHPGIIILEK